MDEILKISKLNKRFDGIKALDDFSCSIGKNEIVGLIGPNGAGKTTLFNVITGFVEPDNGKVIFEGKPITSKPSHRISQLGISRTFQILRIIKDITVLENIMLSFHHQPGENLFKIFFEPKKCNQTESEIKEKSIEYLKEYGLGDKIYSLANDLSYGQQKLLSIVCSLVQDPKILLLDEPVAGLNPTMIDKILEIITKLPSQGKSVVLIEHNMDAINKVCDRIIFMDNGQKITEGKPEEVRNDPRVLEAYLT